MIMHASFPQLGDIGMVWSLDELKNVEDKKLLGGHVALLLGDHNRAQSLYLQSSAPEEALNMRRDLLQVRPYKNTTSAEPSTSILIDHFLYCSNFHDLNFDNHRLCSAQ